MGKRLILKLINTVKEERGQALLLVLILLVMGSLLLPPLLSYASTGLKTGQVYEKKMHELYAADAGVLDAAWMIKNSRPASFPYSYPLSDITGEINDKDIWVTIEEIEFDAEYKVTSIATGRDGVCTTIESYITSGFYSVDFAAAALNGDMTITGGAIISSPLGPADVYANWMPAGVPGEVIKGNVLLGGSKSRVDGKATATNRVIIEGTQTGRATSIVENAPILEFQELDTSEYWDEANGGDTYVNLAIGSSRSLGPARIYGDLTIASATVLTLNGTVWVDGTIYAAGSSYIQGSGTLVAGGNITFEGGSGVQPEGMPVIISTNGNITKAGGSLIYAVLYAPNGTIDIRGNMGVKGAVIGKEVYIASNSYLDFPFALQARDSTGGFRLVTWKIY